MGNGVGKNKTAGASDVSDYVIGDYSSQDINLQASVRAELRGVPFVPPDSVSACINALVQTTAHRGRNWQEDGELIPSRTEAEERLTVILSDWSRLHAKSFSDSLIFEQAHRFFRLSHTLDESWQCFLIERQFPQIFVGVWKCVAFDRSYRPRGKFRPKYLILNMLKEIAAPLMRLGKKMCCALGATEAISLMVKELRHPLFKGDALAKEPESAAWDSPRESLRRTLNIMAYLASMDRDTKPAFCAAQAPEVLGQFSRDPSMLISSRARIALIFLANSDEDSAEDIHYMTQVLESCLEAEDHFSEQYGFSAIEIIHALAFLAANDKNKRELVHSAGILPQLNKMLTSGDHKEETMAAMALWSLSFHPDNKEIIRNHSGIMEVIDKLREAGDKKLYQACYGVMWELGMRSSAPPIEKGDMVMGATENPDAKEEAAPVEGDHTPHIMISYQWDVQARVLQVRDYLKLAGYNVWMDVDNISGSTLEAMADAVEKAAVVLICFTEKYKLSPSCRSEAEYTYKLDRAVIPLRLEADYKPDGWLGIIIGTKLYFDLTLPDLNGEMTKVVKELGTRGKPTPESSEQRGNDASTTSRKEQRRALVGWSQDDVTGWLTSHNLDFMSKCLHGYDGEGLLGLKAMASAAPEFFYKSMREELGVKTMLEIIRFKNALDGVSVR